MCGRTACTLVPDDIQRACAYKKKGGLGGKWTLPEWTPCPSGRTYNPSSNVAPTSHTPVLIAKRVPESSSSSSSSSSTSSSIAEAAAAAAATSSSSEDDNKKEKADLERIIVPMYWSLVPSWHKGHLNELGLSTNNARYEGITDKPMFNVPLKKGRRCVVLADGYYEWQELTGKEKKLTGLKKQPYLIYFPQPDGIKAGDSSSWKERLGKRAFTVKNGWKGPRLLTMAGVYDIWKDPKDETSMYSYAVVTLDASRTLSFIHDRMPAILDGDDAVRDWLDVDNVPLEKALKLIRPVTNLEFHPVSKDVGNSRNKSPSIVEPIDPKKDAQTDSKSRSLMENWLKTPSPSPKSTDKRKFSESE